MSESSAKELVGRSSGTQISLKIDDAQVLIVYSIALFIIAGVQRVLDYNSIDALFEFNAAELLALYAIYCVVKPKFGAAILSRTDLFVIAACSLLMLPPISMHFAFFGAGIAGLYFLLRAPRLPELIRLGQLWLAISCYESFGRLLFKLVSGPLMRAELLFIGKVGPWLGFHFVQDGIRLVSPAGWYIFMMERCSSFHNISLALLIWLSLLTIAEAQVHRRQIVALVAAVVLIILLNALRIMLMTLSEGSYNLWHGGAGTLIFSCATFIAVVLPTAMSLGRRA